MFEKMMLHIIPTLNPDGAEIATAGQCTGELLLLKAACLAEK
jgi:murein tripeptide amidase MpaA